MKYLKTFESLNFTEDRKKIIDNTTKEIDKLKDEYIKKIQDCVTYLSDVYESDWYDSLSYGKFDRSYDKYGYMSKLKCTLQFKIEENSDLSDIGDLLTRSLDKLKNDLNADVSISINPTGKQLKINLKPEQYNNFFSVDVPRFYKPDKKYGKTDMIYTLELHIE